MSEPLTPEREERLRQFFGGGNSTSGVLLAEIDRLRAEVKRLTDLREAFLQDKTIAELRAALADRDRQLAELREACQPIVALVTPEVYSSVRCVAVTDLRRLAALLPPTPKEDDRAAKE